MSNTPNDPFYLFGRGGTSSSPFKVYNEPLSVFEGRVLLTEVPRQKNHVVVKDGSTVYGEVYDSGALTTDNVYFVDYDSGTVYFDNSHNGKQLTFTYTGEGYFNIPARRVYTQIDSSDIPSQNLQDMIDNYNQLNGTDLYNLFDPQTGHKHTGASGDAPPIDSLYVSYDDGQGLITNVNDTLNDHATQLANIDTDLSNQATQSNQRFNMTTYKVTNNNDYTAWPQDKCFSLNGVLYVLYNEGTGHSSSDLLPKFKRSYDGGITWSEPYILYQDTINTWSLGITCWGAGVDNTRFYSIVKCSGTDNTVGNSKQLLIYGAHVNGFLHDPNSMAVVPITLSKTINGVSKIPSQFHSFASLPDGSIAFGYYYEDGEVGIAKTFDLGVTWETHIMYTASQMTNTINLVEATMCVDSTNNVVVGFLRAERTDLQLSKFFISRDNCKTFTFYETGITTSQSPMPIKMIGSTYYAFYTERYNNCNMFLLTGNASDVLANGFSSFTSQNIGKGYHDSANSASGMGVGSLVPFNNDLHIFFSSENLNGNADIYQIIYKTTTADTDIVTLNAIPTKRFYEKSKMNLIARSSQSFTASTATILDLKEALDVLDEYDGTNNQIVVKQSGLYAISLSMYLNTVPDGNQSYVEMFVAGSGKRIAWSNNGANQPDLLHGSIITYITQGTIVQFKLTTQNATTLNTATNTTWLNFYRID